MLAERYFDVLSDTLRQLRETQLATIDRAAELVVESVTNGGVLHLFDTGHMLEREAVHRAGGLVMVTPFHFTLELDNPARPRSGDTGATGEDVVGLIRYTLASSRIRTGDVLLIGSVSGRAAIPIELAIQARAMGVRVIALTSIAYSKVAEVQHSSGKRLYEVADLAIDYVGPLGDAALDVEGLETGVCPTSGIVAATINWALTAQVVERLLAKGLTPHVFRSVNLPDGPAFNDRQRKEYERLGY
jgi:uncharacterized phosphosugar-binding protein